MNLTGRISFLIYIILALPLFFNHAAAETIVNTNIGQDTTWNTADSPYIIDSDVTITNGVLSINAGVSVEFNGNYSITVGGNAALEALGEKGSEIYFTNSAGTSYWNQIFFTATSLDASFNADGLYTGGSILKYVIINNTDPSNNEAAVYAEGVAPYFDHVTIQNNQQGAIYIKNPNNPVKIVQSTIDSNNSSSAAKQPVIFVEGGAQNSSGLVISGSNISNNGTDSTASNYIISCTTCGNIQLLNNRILYNKALLSGAIYVSNLSGDVSQNKIDRNVISGNRALSQVVPTINSGAIFVVNSKVNIEYNIIDFNESSYDAGAVLLTNNASAAIINNFISSNKSNNDAAAISILNASMADISKNFVTNNVAYSSSGAVHVRNPGGAINIFDNLFIYNLAQNGHGATVHSHNPTGDNSHKINIHNNVFVGNRVGVVVDSQVKRSIDEGDCIYISDSDGAILNNVFTGTGYVNCIYLANGITGGIKNNVFDGVSNGESLIRLFNGANTYLSAETTLINNNNFFANNTTYAYIDTTELNPTDTITINATMNWWDQVSPAMVTPANTDSSDGLSVPDVSAPISSPQNVIAEFNNGVLDISWDANPESDVAGYRIYWVVDKEYFQFEHVQDAGLVTQFSLIPEVVGSYTLAVTAYKSSYNSANDDSSTYVNENQTAGTESWYSNPIDKVSVNEIIEQKPIDNQNNNSGGGGGGAINLLFLLIIYRLANRRFRNRSYTSH